MSDRSPSTEPTPARPGRGVKILGAALAIVAVGFCGYALARDWDRVTAAFSGADRPVLALSVVTGAVSMVWLAVLWHRCLAALGVRAPVTQVVGWYFVGELGKYIPGGVWQVIGRSELAHRSRGVRRATAYASTLLAYGVMCLGAVFLCGLMSPFLASGSDGATWAWLFAPAVIAVPVLTHPGVARAVVSLLSRVTRRSLTLEPLPWSTTLSLIAWSVPAWVFLGASSASVAHALDVDADLPRVALAAVAAWVVGFLAVPVPAGAGVREIVFASLSGLAVGPAVAIAVLARAVLIVVDAVGGLAALAFHRRGGRAADVLT